MALLVVSLDGRIVQEWDLKDERTTIGRRLNNDIILDNRAVSGEHAVIVRMQREHLIEDLNSTNGTFVNGQPIKKHFLQDNDTIELINYRLLYKKSNTKSPQAAAVPATAAAESAPKGYLKVLSGANAGRELSLDKETTTIGRAGTHLAAVIRQPDGYFVRHVEGERYTRLNGEPVGSDPYPLAHGDVIDLSGTRIGFKLRKQ